MMQQTEMCAVREMPETAVVPYRRVLQLDSRQQSRTSWDEVSEHNCSIEAVPNRISIDKHSWDLGENILGPSTFEI